MNFCSLMGDDGLLRGVQSWVMQLLRFEGNYGAASAMIIIALSASIICCAGLIAICAYSSKKNISFINSANPKPSRSPAAGIMLMLIFIVAAAAVVLLAEHSYEALVEVDKSIHLVPSAAAADMAFILFSTFSVILFGALIGFGIARCGTVLTIPCAVISFFTVPSIVTQTALNLTEHSEIYRWIINLPNALTLGLALSIINGRTERTFGYFIRRICPVLPFTAVSVLYFETFNLVATRFGIIADAPKMYFAGIFYSFLRAGGRIYEPAAVSGVFALLASVCIICGICYADRGGKRTAEHVQPPHERADM